MMDIKSPRILKLKGALFVLIGLLAALLMFMEHFSWRNLLLFLLAIWAFCRAYYFCFYVLHHYVDPSFRYAGLFALIKQWVSRRH
ncbi:MAG: hypothetical protein SFY80_12395 [Verrucomicrobiota bacterium]|nr:hypothetical protein [Verrucomicrobiota bacterium]